MRALIVCTLIIFCFSTIVFGQKFQRSFYDENSFEKPVEIPGYISDSLKKDDDVQKCLKMKEGSESYSEWFEAAKIDLNGDQFSDLIVKAKEGCSLITGNASKFWFFVNENGKYIPVLSDFTISVEILRSRTRSFYNIATHRSTASRVYSTVYIFNGKKYVRKA